MVLVLKTSGCQSPVGSNPTPPAIWIDMIQREGLIGRLKEDCNIWSEQPHRKLPTGERFVLTELTMETGGSYFNGMHASNWIWYIEADGLKPCSGKWWSDGVNGIRRRLDIEDLHSNPFLKFTEGCRSG